MAVEDSMFKIGSVFFIVLLVFPLVSAQGETEQIQDLVKNKVSCSKLSEQQLELIGEYYMEQMHPGEEHIALMKQIGGLDSETVRKEHFKIAQENYCDDFNFPYWLLALIIAGLLVIAFLVFRD